MWAHLGREETLPLPSHRSRVEGQGQLQTARCNCHSGCELGRGVGGLLLVHVPLLLLLTFAWVSTSLLVPLWQDSWILGDMAPKVFLAE